MKCTGKFKEDFDNICALKNIKYVPDVISRSKRPGSSLQIAIIAQQQVNQQQQQSEMVLQNTSKKLGNTTKGKLLFPNINQNVDADHEIQQNPGFLKINLIIFTTFQILPSPNPFFFKF